MKTRRLQISPFLPPTQTSSGSVSRPLSRTDFVSKGTADHQTPVTEMPYFPFWTRGPGFYSSGRCDISPHGCNFNTGAFGVLAGVDAGQSVKAGWHADLGTRPARVPLLFARRDDPGDVPEPLPACFPPSRGHYCHLVTGGGVHEGEGSPQASEFWGGSVWTGGGWVGSEHGGDRVEAGARGTPGQDGAEMGG